MTRRDVIVIAFLVPATLATACQRTGTPAVPAEPPMLNLTHWTDRTELYMEYPPLIAAQPARFAVHVTKLDDFKALNAGRPRIELTPEGGGAPTVFAGSDPLRPGAFRVDGTAPAAGRYTWAVFVGAPGLSDRHDLGSVIVFGDEKTATAEAEKQPGGDPAAFAYLKEQQWTNEFSTAQVRDAELRGATRVPATIEALPGGEAIVSAPAGGRFMAGSLPTIGASVRAGQTLGRLEPRLAGGDDRATLTAQGAEARAVLDAARIEHTRAERLLADRAVPARRVEDARRAVAVAEARLQAAETRLAQRDETLTSGGGAAGGNSFALRAPIAGRVAEVTATLGASYDEGARLFKIVRTDRVELRAQVPAADAESTRGVASLAFEIPGRSDPIVLQPRRTYDAGIIDPRTRALPVQFEVENPGGRLLVGQTGTAVLYKSDRARGPAVPRVAVLLEAGRPYVFIQVGGERFVRRYVEIATRDGDLIGIKSGLQAGDRVVIKGAYEVQLASVARGLPAEGHVH